MIMTYFQAISLPSLRESSTSKIYFLYLKFIFEKGSELSNILAKMREFWIVFAPQYLIKCDVLFMHNAKYVCRRQRHIRTTVFVGLLDETNLPLHLAKFWISI